MKTFIYKKAFCFWISYEGDMTISVRDVEWPLVTSRDSLHKPDV